MDQKQFDLLMKGVAFPLGIFCALYRTTAAQHGIFAMKMVHSWNFDVNVQGTSLCTAASSVPSVRVTS